MTILNRLFKLKMCNYPPALFDSSLLLRKANKPVLADAIWTRTKNEQATQLTGNFHYVLDGGALLHPISWSRGLTYHEIISFYVQHVTQRYGQATVVFDGYEEGPSLKNCANQRRSTVSGPSVHFDGDMVLELRKGVFLSHPANKQRLIELLGEKLQSSRCKIYQCPRRCRPGLSCSKGG